jgi:1A family penicillin-binding protein
MYRQGRYTKKRGPINATKVFVKRSVKWYKNLPRWKKIAYPIAPVLLFLIVVPIATYLYYYNDIGDIDRLLNKNNSGVVMTDKNDKVFYTTPGSRAEHRELVGLDKISDSTEHALIASEDKDFYKHGGFSPLSIVRAMYTNVVARGIAGGGSTLTQQLAKNTLLTKNQTILRKYQELTIATAIEQRYSKDEILTMYLNSVYYGENSFGIEEAARNYFNKTPAELTLAESSMLIGVLPAPSAYSPVSGDPSLAKERQTTVLTRMVKNGYITEAEKQAALGTALAYAPQKSPLDNAAPHYTEMILNQLYKKYGEEKVERSGYQVKTTLDLDLQDKANAAVAKGMPHIQANGGTNASLIAIDPKTGEIRALVGSADYSNDQFGKVNMTTTARQPGSSFKPIYYADALANGKITPVTTIKDEKTDFGGYTPLNASRTFYGDVTVRQALNWSLNIPAVKVMQKEGVADTITASKKLGITTLKDTNDYGLSLALGVAEVPLDQMTNAYAAFGNSGKQYDTTSIQSIDDKYGGRIFTSDQSSKQAISEQGAYLISNILSDNATRGRVFGSSLNVTGTDRKTKTVAVKTGTTEDARDAWTIGYTPDIAIGVWVGNNDNTEMQSGGADMAGPIWRQAMGQAIGSSSPTFVQPSGIVKQTVCSGNKQQTDVFLNTNVPAKCEQKAEETKPTESEKPAQVDTKKCTVAGKESLLASDANCKEDMCTVGGKENLAANDPNCKSAATLDSDNDGVLDTVDQCPNTPTGIKVNAVGCGPNQTPSTGTGSGNRPGGTSNP